MSMPGFTATAALDTTRGRYATGPGRPDGTPASKLALESSCGSCTCAKNDCCIAFGPWCDCIKCSTYSHATLNMLEQ